MGFLFISAIIESEGGGRQLFEGGAYKFEIIA